VLDFYAHEMIPRAVETCRETRRFPARQGFVWTLPAWPLVQAMARLRGSVLGEELEGLVTEGRITWHALPFTTHTELFGLEDLIRGLYIGRSLRERFGLASRAAKMTDVPGHTWILPSLLAAAGVTFLHLGCNSCSTPPDVPALFNWEGPDGARVMTMYSRGGYGSSLLPPPEWKLPIWLALQHTTDNAVPPGAQAVERILRAAAEGSPGTEVVIASLDEFAREISRLAPDLPVVRGDLADSWIHGAATMPRELASLRAVRNRLEAAESAGSIRELLAAPPAAAEPWRGGSAEALGGSASAAYEALLLFGEHTWGLDTKLALNPPEFGGRVYEKRLFRAARQAGGYDRIIRSWSDKAALVNEAERHVRSIEAGRQKEGADGADALPARFDVVNHHPWRWSGPLPVGRFARPVRIIEEPAGTPVAVTVRDGVVWADLRGVPPLAAVRIAVEAGSQPGPFGQSRIARDEGGRLVLDNGRVRVIVDRGKGGIVGLVDHAAHRDWVDRTLGLPFGQYRYDVYSRREVVDYLKAYADDLEPWFLADFGKPDYPQKIHRTFLGVLADARAENGRGWGALTILWRQESESVLEYGNAAEVSQRITLFAGLPWIDIEYRLIRKEECLLLEAGHVVLPLAARRPRYAINKTGCVIDPARDIVPGANRLLYCLERWVDIADRRGGLLVIPFDTPLFSIGGPAIERFDGSAVPGEPVLYFNLFNTQWGTNFPQWIGGDFRFRFRLIPHTGDWRKAEAWKQAVSAIQPPACLPARSAAAPTPGLLAEPVAGLETVVCKRAEADDGWILRLRDPTGRGGTRSLRLRVPGEILRCSLLEDEQRALPVSSDPGGIVVKLDFRPFEVVTLKLKP
jgi:alpha-mannosidase